MSGTAINLFFLVILTFMNGFCCFAEVCVVASRKARLQVMLEEGDIRAQAAMDMRGNPTVALATTQTGITAIQVLSGILGANALAQPASELFLFLHVPESTALLLGNMLVFVLVTYFEIVFGELVPKRIGQVDPEGYLCSVAGLMKVLGRIARPFIWLLSITTNASLKLLGIKSSENETVTEEEISAILEEGSKNGVIEQNELEMVQNVFELDDRTAGSVMIPRNDIVWVDTEESREQNIKKVSEANHSHLVVAEGSLDNIKGFCSTRKVLKAIIASGQVDFENCVTPGFYVPETLSVMDLLEKFKETDAPSAFVVNEYGEVVGMVTLRDVVEAIAGEFKPSSKEDAMAVAQNGTYSLDGMIAIPELKDTLNLAEVPQEGKGAYNTLSGLLMLCLERIPRIGDKVTLGDWKLEVTEMEGRRVSKVFAERKPQPPAKTAEEKAKEPPKRVYWPKPEDEAPKEDTPKA